MAQDLAVAFPREKRPMATRIQKNCGVSMRRGLVAGFVDDEVAVVEGLDAEVVEIEVGGGIEASASLSRS
jgi:hypothetical protein